jgi:hypothetical protein
MQSLDALVVGMSMFGPGLIAGAVAAALAKAMGADRQIGILAGAAAIIGAGFGYVAIARPALPSLPSFGDLAPGFGAAKDEADLERVLKTYYPDDYVQVKTALDALKSGRAAQVDTERALRTIAFPLMLRQLPLASTENTTAYLAITRDEQALLAKNPELCGRVMDDPDPDTLHDMAAAMPPALRQREAHVAIQLLEQTATHPQPPSPKPDTDQELTIWSRDAANGLSFEERDALRAGGSEGHAAAECKVFGNLLYTLVNDYPPDGAEVFKALLAKGAARFGG